MVFLKCRYEICFGIIFCFHLQVGFFDKLILLPPDRIANMPSILGKGFFSIFKTGFMLTLKLPWSCTAPFFWDNRCHPFVCWPHWKVFLPFANGPSEHPLWSSYYNRQLRLIETWAIRSQLVSVLALYFNTPYKYFFFAIFVPALNASYARIKIPSLSCASGFCRTD